MNFIYVTHLMCWNYLIGLIDLITHTAERETTGPTAFTATTEGGARVSARPPFVVTVPAVVSVVSVSAVCDQGDQVVPAHQVDDIDEAHELDPVHQVDHKDEHPSHHITSHHITSHHITSHHITSHRIASHHITSHHITSRCLLFIVWFGWTFFGQSGLDLSLIHI